MSIRDKSGVFDRLQRGERISLELGCGPKKMNAEAVGVDMLDFDGVDLVGDAFEALSRIPDGSVNNVYTSHFLEHVPDLPRMMTEISRVLARSGKVVIVVPHFSNPFYYSDPTHKTPFGLYTLAYFCRQSIFRRTVPQYALALPLELSDVQLQFKSYPPRYVRHAFKKFMGAVFNSAMYLREFYEENLCWLVPCYQVRYELTKT